MGTSHAVAVSSGFASLVCGLAALGVGPGDEVIIPAYTWIASAEAVVAVGAVPILAEIDQSLGPGGRRVQDYRLYQGNFASSHARRSMPDAEDRGAGAISRVESAGRCRSGSRGKLFRATARSPRSRPHTPGSLPALGKGAQVFFVRALLLRRLNYNPCDREHISPVTTRS
jgi:hypothetical protein